MASGTITCQEFGAQFPVKCQDQAIKEVEGLHWDMFEDVCYHQVDPDLWPDATQECQFRGVFALSADMRGKLHRKILFLQSDLDYSKETTLTWWQTLLLTPFLCAGLLLGACIMCALIASTGLWMVFLIGPSVTVVAFFIDYIYGHLTGRDYSCLPFVDPKDYEEALRHPKLLCGKRAA